MRFHFGLAAALAVVAAGVPAQAHHSFAMFDLQKQVTVSGTVRQFQWTNPHAYIQLVAKDASGNDVEGKADTFNVDFSMSYEINDTFAVSFEAINLTDQYDERWINSARKNSNNYEHTGREFVVGLRYKY